MGRTRSQPGSKASPTDWGHSEDKRWVLGHLSSHRSAQVFICRKSHPPKVGPRLLRVAEGLCGAHSRLRPAPSSRRGRRGQDGCMPILRPCPAGLERWRRENGRCRAQGCRGRDNGFTGRVPAPFCSMGHPHQGGDGCICPCSFSGVSGHEKGRSVSITRALGVQWLRGAKCGGRVAFCTRAPSGRRGPEPGPARTNVLGESFGPG